MAQKAYIIEGISGKDILEHEPIASQIAEGFQVSSINAFNKDGKSMCLVLLSDGESSGGGGGDYLAPPVFSPISHPVSPYTSKSGSIEVALTAEEGAVIFYSINSIDSTFAPYEEPIVVTVNGTIIYAFANKVVDGEGEVSPVVAAAYYLGGK